MTFFVEIIKSSRNEINMRKIMSNVIKNNSYAYKGLNVYFDVFFQVHAFIDLYKVIERGFMESSLILIAHIKIRYQDTRSALHYCFS